MSEDWKSDRRFTDFIGWVLQREGSKYEDVPGDNGGPTKYGIDLNGHKWLTVDQIKNMTADQASAIYYKESWIDVHAGEMPFPVGEMVSDIDINGGHAVLWLQLCLNLIDRDNLVADGKYGPATAAALAHASPSRVEICMLNKRNAFFEGLAQAIPHDRQFLTGWLSRDRLLTQYIAKESVILQSIPHPSSYLT